eukprot:5573294-Lingulodinium_polyedra.AAC.1
MAAQRAWARPGQRGPLCLHTAKNPWRARHRARARHAAWTHRGGGGRGVCRAPTPWCHANCARHDEPTSTMHGRPD